MIRPYNIDEWNSKYPIGTCLKIRDKEYPECFVEGIYIGYECNTKKHAYYLNIGGSVCDIEALSELYEVYDNGKWLPLGVEE